MKTCPRGQSISNALLLDTNIISALLRDPHGPVRQHIERVGEASICTSIVVAAELRYGAALRGSVRLAEQVEGALSVIPVLALESPADRVYGEIRTRLAQAGQPIGAVDLLIAAHAVALGCTIVTDNVREFSRVAGLSLENWLRDPA